MFDSLNYLAVLVAAILAFGVGGLWYGPLYSEADCVAKSEEFKVPSARVFQDSGFEQNYTFGECVRIHVSI